MSSSVKELVDQAIKNEKVVVFSKSYCPVRPVGFLSIKKMANLCSTAGEQSRRCNKRQMM